MSGVNQLLSELNARGIKLWLDGERLRYRSPKGALTTALRQKIGTYKAEIMDFLRQAKQAASTRASMIQAVPCNRELPLSFPQKRLWLLGQSKEASDAYHIPLALHLCGPLEIESLSTSYQLICERHEALRTTFVVVDGQVRQQINPPNFNLEIIDLSHLPKHEKNKKISHSLQKEAIRSFCLTTGPLWRVTLFRLGSQEHVLLLTVHHIISDGWSATPLIRECSALYAGQKANLPELPIQYANFAVWQHESLSSDLFQQQFYYWKKQLAGAPSFLPLPTDHPRPAQQSYRGDHISFILPDRLHADLKDLSKKNHTTLFMTLQAAFAVLLSRYSAQEDICIGTPIANRQVPEVENLIGFFINLLVLRNDLSGNPTFCNFLKRVREVTLGAYQHQDLPFQLLVEKLQPEYSLSYTPFFQVMFVLHNTPQAALSFSGLTASRIEVQYPIAKYDLALDMQERQEGLTGSWRYNTDIFQRATIDRMTADFQTLLEGIVTNPNQPIAYLPLLSSANYPSRQNLED